jgi:hypothetical protein
MKTLHYSLWGGLLLLTGAWLFSESTPFAALNGFFAWRGVLNQYTGALAMGVMSLAIILAVRPRWLEGPLDGLDKLYRLHKWLGIAGLTLAVTHWLLAKVPKWLVGWGWLERPKRGPRPPLEPVLNYPIAVKSKPHGKPQTLPIRCQRRRMGVRRTVPDPVPPGRRAAQTLTARGVQRRALCGALWLPVAHAAQ